MVVNAPARRSRFGRTRTLSEAVRFCKSAGGNGKNLWGETCGIVGVFTLGLGAITALSKSKKHFVGITWADGDKKGGLAMQCDKNDYRGILAGLEGVSGKKAVDSEAMTVKN